MPEQMIKANILRNHFKDKNFSIEVDGGVNLETIGTIKKHPVDICVSGTCIFKSQNINETINKLRME